MLAEPRVFRRREPTELNVRLFGWNAGTPPVVNPNNEGWNRGPIVDLFQQFTKWGANGDWASQIFVFAISADVKYIGFQIVGKNHWGCAYVAF